MSLKEEVKGEGVGDFAVNDSPSGQVSSPILVLVTGGEEPHVVLQIASAPWAQFTF
jgi:hypothetical protein